MHLTGGVHHACVQQSQVSRHQGGTLASEVMFRPRKRRLTSFTLATASLSSTSNSPAKDIPFNSFSNVQTAPVHLRTFQPTASDTNTFDAAPTFAPPRKKNLLEWIFPFLADGTTSLVAPATSDALGPSNNPALFPQRQATGGLLSHVHQNSHPPKDQPRSTVSNTNPQDSRDTFATSTSSASTNHPVPPWSSWKHWKKISLDFYIRLLDTPQYSRLRLKQTIAPLPIIKLKPVMDLAYRGPDKSPLTMHMDVKILDCIKYRVHTDGSSHLQVRARAPMSDPRFTMDVIYERQLGTALDSVKITFRALDVAFLKAPSPGFGCKFPIRFNNGIKATIRVKKFIDRTHDIASAASRTPKISRRTHPVAPKSRKPRQDVRLGPGERSTRHLQNPSTGSLGIYGPIGIDIKLRCLEYR